jgi:iron complex outermembrane receptor protein
MMNFHRRSLIASICKVSTLLSVGEQIVSGAAQIDSEPTATVVADESVKREIAVLESLSLAELLNADVTSVSKKKEKLFDTAAAVFVINSDDIRRSGARSIPEALRMAPGLSVAQVSANTWAITSRGFVGAAGRLADKLLVLVDGRPVYHNNGNGVFWQVQDYVLEDIDRIEVVRGPGGTLWGANAVNGVINIISKDSIDTEGVYVTGGGGTEDRAFASVRYATELSDDAFTRFYAKYRNRADYTQGRDGSDFGQVGFRTDWHTDNSKLTWQGDGFVEDQRASAVIPNIFAANPFPFTDTRYKHLGANTILTYQRQLENGSDLQLKAYYDFSIRKELGTTYENHNLDLDFQHRLPVGERNDLIYGMEYRYLPMRMNDNTLVTWRDPEIKYQLFSAFLQNETEVVKERLWLTLGSKFEHNDFTGFEIQPNARLRWKPADNQTVWGAVSRAVQVPGPTLQGARLPVLALNTGTPGTFLGSGTSNPQFPATVLVAYELGYRVQVSDALTLDGSAFYNDYDNLPAGMVDFTTDLVAPAFVPPIVFPVNGNSTGAGHTYGFEVSSRWQAEDWWRITANYTFMESRLNAFIRAGQEPESQVSLQSSMDLGGHVELDIWGRYVSPLYNFGGGSINVDSYFDLDIRVGWKPRANLEFSIVGQNLISPRRQEFGPNPAAAIRIAQVPRGVYGQVAYKF